MLLFRAFILTGSLLQSVLHQSVCYVYSLNFTSVLCLMAALTGSWACVLIAFAVYCFAPVHSCFPPLPVVCPYCAPFGPGPVPCGSCTVFIAPLHGVPLCLRRYPPFVADEFKPASIDTGSPGSLHKGAENKVTVEFSNNQAGKPKVAFQGNSEDCKDLDAVIFFDGTNFRLERLHRAVKSLRHVRLPGESAAAAAAAAAASAGGLVSGGSGIDLRSSPLHMNGGLAPTTSEKTPFKAHVVRSCSLSVICVYCICFEAKCISLQLILFNQSLKWIMLMFGMKKCEFTTGLLPRFII